MQAEVIAVGSELLLGQIVDTNSAVIARQRTIDGHGGGNLVLYASDTPLDRGAVEAAIGSWNEGASTGIVSRPGDLATFIGQSPILTDDYAPVDQLLGR